MTTTPSERQRILADLSTVAIRDLVALWERAKLADVAFAAFLIDAFPEIATSYALIAGNLAADWYEQAAPRLAYEAVTAPAPNVTALTKSAQWALGADGDMALNRLSGNMQRTVFNSARETTFVNVNNEEGARWARHASANACPWCRLLATRLDVYRSEQSALRSHDRCHCVAVEVRPGQSYDPPPYIEDWTDQYHEARDNADSGDIKQITAAWRELLKQNA